MKKKPANILFSPVVKQMQTQQGSRDFIQRLEERAHWGNQLSLEQIQFVQNRES
jgi:hypothetical protein